MRTYHLAAAALALSCPPKWLDNVLSRYDVAGVERDRRGVSRRISFDALIQLAIVRRLVEELDIPLRRAVTLAPAIMTSGDGSCAASATCRLCVDVPALRRAIASGVREAAEVAVPPRRGRPPKRDPAHGS